MLIEARCFVRALQNAPEKAQITYYSAVGSTIDSRHSEWARLTSDDDPKSKVMPTSVDEHRCGLALTECARRAYQFAVDGGIQPQLNEDLRWVSAIVKRQSRRVVHTREPCEPDGAGSHTNDGGLSQGLHFVQRSRIDGKRGGGYASRGRTRGWFERAAALRRRSE